MMCVYGDWTFDLFAEDAEKYQAKPMRGIHCSKNASDREKFMVWFKNCARDFKEAWLKSHDGCLYDRYDGWIGDAFAREFSDMCFSDFYKDTYYQRPHLPNWYYVQVTGLPTGEDVAYTFCSSPAEDAVYRAKVIRHMLASESEV